MGVTNNPIRNKDSGAADVRVVVLHHTAGSYPGDYNTLWGPAEVSIHVYIRKSGQIYLGVPMGRAAWHCGPSMWRELRGINQYSIGIELENWGDSKDPYPLEQLKALDWVLIILIRPKYGNLPITRHRDINPGKIDPSNNFPWGDYSGGIAQVVQRMQVSGKDLQEDEMAFDTVRMEPSKNRTKWHGHYDNTYPGVKECWIIIQAHEAQESGKPWPFRTVTAVVWKTQGPKKERLRQIDITVGDNFGYKLPGPYTGAIEIDVPDADEAQAVTCYVRTVT